MTEQTKKTTLFAKIALASLSVGSLVAEGNMKQSGQSYEYLTSDQVLREAGRALAQVGIAIIPGIANTEIQQVEYTNSSGRTSTRYDAKLGMLMHVGDTDGNEASMKWAAAGTDYGSPDKAVSKAVTTGHKYFLAKLLCMNIGEDNGVKPFHKAMADNIAYFKGPDHVENVMNLLVIPYPGNKAEAEKADKELSRYARMRADGTEQDEVIRTIKGARNGSIDDLR